MSPKASTALLWLFVINAESVTVAMLWMTLNYFRHGLVFSGWMAALKAFSLRYQTRPALSR